MVRKIIPNIYISVSLWNQLVKHTSLFDVLHVYRLTWIWYIFSAQILWNETHFPLKFKLSEIACNAYLRWCLGWNPKGSDRVLKLVWLDFILYRGFLSRSQFACLNQFCCNATAYVICQFEWWDDIFWKLCANMPNAPRRELPIGSI